MNHSHTTVSLGFTDEQFPPGTHICQIYSDDAEREESLAKFILSGLQAKECTACFSDNIRIEELTAYLAENGISYEACENDGLISVVGTRDIYFEDGKFDPSRMLDLLTVFHENSVAKGAPAARVIGEMDAVINDTPGGERLLEYESRVTMLLAEHPVTAVCQYDAKAFDGKTIMDILKVHPLMVVRGAVVRNPFFISPEEFLSEMNEGT